MSRASRLSVRARKMEETACVTCHFVHICVSGDGITDNDRRLSMCERTQTRTTRAAFDKLGIELQIRLCGAGSLLRRWILPHSQYICTDTGSVTLPITIDSRYIVSLRLSEYAEGYACQSGHDIDHRGL